MLFRALGSLTAHSDGRALPLGGRKQKMVLALLLINANRTVSIDRLIDGVWGDDPPKAARHTLHAYMSELRKQLDGLPAREGVGYVMRVDADQFDVMKFETLAEQGHRLLATDPVAAAERLATALALWEGAPYADLSGEPGVEGEARRLSELRLNVVEHRIESDLAGGHHAALIPELEALVREHPFRERFWAQLMLSLYQGGRQAEALRAYRKVREILGDELGIDPSLELQSLELKILEQDISVTRPAAFSEAPSGQSLRGYELRQLIGEGDFGAVYEAYQPSMARQVAVKQIRAEYANNPSFVRRFEAEEQFVAELEHPHIVPIFDYWRDHNGAYLVMPQLRGGSLAQALHRGPWNSGPALRLLDQIGAALSYAHRQGIVHRDLKPSNVLLDADGNAYLSDFGISARLTDHAGAPLTTALPYVSPEELRGEPLTVASDLYCLAILIFELFTGVRPPELTPLPPIDQVRPDLPVALAEALRKATADRPDERYERVEDLLRDVRQGMGADVVGAVIDGGPLVADAPIRNPYKGLRAFQETDTVDFHGRDRLIDELLRAVTHHRLVCVVGPSGSGKSSVVRAGLVPALRAGAITGSAGWLITAMFPGSYPFEEMESALLRVAVDDPGSLVSELLADERGLMRVVKRILPHDDSELVLIVDQFEELFSMVDDDATRQLLLNAITAAVNDERSRVRVILTLRADFFDRPLDYPRFGELVREGMVAVTTLDDDALALAISRPARGVGLDLEPGLVGEIIGEVRSEPGGLPLLQYALTEMVQRRRGRDLTIDAYRSAGGVAAALGRRAEELYTALSPDGQETTRQLFLRLVSVDDESDDTRRRVRKSELEALEVDRNVIENVIQQFASYRLLTFDRDPVTRSPTVEVAHEALIREWLRLRDWIEEQRASLAIHRRFSAALQDWQNSTDADAFLLSGGRLQQFLEWAGTTELSLTREEVTFLDRSRSAESRRRRRMAVLRGSAMIALAGLAVFAFGASRVAQRENRQATIRDLAGQSSLALAEDPERAILLALEAVDLSREVGEEPLPEALGSLNGAVQTSRLERRLEDGFGNVAASPDGRLFATDVFDRDIAWAGTGVAIWDAETGTRLHTLESGEFVSTGHPMPGAEGGRSLAFNPDGSLLAVATQSGGEQTPIVLWDPSTGREVGRLMAPGGASWDPVWTADGARLIAGSSAGPIHTVTIWDVSSHQVAHNFDLGFVGEIALVDDHTLVATHGPEERIGFYDLDTGEETDRLETLGLESHYLAVDREGQRLAVSARHQQVQVWHLESKSMLWTRPLSSSRRVVVDPTGDLLSLTGAEGLIRLLDLDDGSEVMQLAGHPTAVGDVAFDPTGDHLISAGNDGTTRVWNIAPVGPPLLGAISIGSGRPFLLDFSPDTAEIGVSTWDGTFERHDVGSGELLGLIEGLVSDAVVNPIVSPDWSRLGAVDAGGQGAMLDLRTGEIVSMLPPCSNPRAFSPDGSLAVLEGVWLCPPGQAPDGVELRSRVIDLSTDAEVLDLGERIIFRAAFNPGGEFQAGRYLAINADTLVLEIFDLATGEVIASLENFPTMIRFDPTGRYLASGTLDGVVVVIDLAALVDGAEVEEALVMNQQVAPGGIPGIAISSNGLVATSAFDSSFVRVWDFQSGDLVAELRTGLDGASPPHLNFSPDGQYLLYPDAGNILRKYLLNPDRLVEIAESRLTRALTDDECERFLAITNCR